MRVSRFSKLCFPIARAEHSYSDQEEGFYDWDDIDTYGFLLVATLYDYLETIVTVR